MSRLLAVALGCGLVGASTAAGADPITSPSEVDEQPKRAKARASKKKATKTKAKAAKTAKASKSKAKQRKKVASAKRRPRVKPSKQPLVKVAKLQVDGRVKFGADRMPPGFAWPPTKQMRTASKACEQALDTLKVSWQPGSAEGMIVDPVVVPSMEIGGIKYVSAYKKPPHRLDCQFVHALALVGPELRALGVREVQFGSIYRNTMARSHGQTKNFTSRHALGIAMDIKAFVDANGRVASVEMDYLKGDELLHGVEDMINRNTRLRQVLTPGNDPISHYDHFHIEATVDFTGFR